MKKSLLFILMAALLTGCVTDKYSLKNGERDELFLKPSQNNHQGHLFWTYLRDKDNKIIKNDKSKLLFSPERDTLIFVHGWAGVGRLGWTNHSIMRKANAFNGIIISMISFMYNIPDKGTEFPKLKEKITQYNYAYFDWQNYNQLEGDYETTESLPKLESYLKENPPKWPLVPENLAMELEYFFKKTNYDKKMILVAHSFGSQVLIRAYDMLSEETKAKISQVILLDPFSSFHFDYMLSKMPTKPAPPKNFDIHMFTGSTNPFIKEDLLNIVKKSKIYEKMTIIISTDIGEGFYKYIGEPLNITLIDKDFQKVPFNLRYARKVKRLHNDILNWLFLRGKYDEDLGLD